MNTFIENHYGDYRSTEQSNSLRACGATIGGGSEVLVIYEEYSRHCWRETNISAPLRVKEPYGGGEVLILESNQNHATVQDTEVCTCLPASMGLGGGYVPMIVMQRRFRDVRVQDTETAPSLEAGCGDGGNNVPMVVEPVVFRPEQTIKVDCNGTTFTLESREYKAPQCVVSPSSAQADVLPFDTTQATSDKNWSHPKYGDPCHPLANGQHPPAVAIKKKAEDEQMNYSLQAFGVYKQTEAASALKMRDYKDATDLITGEEGDAMESVVRRLTPLE